MGKILQVVGAYFGLLQAISFNNGIIICWGFLLQINYPTFTITYPVAFTINNACIIIQAASSTRTYHLNRSSSNCVVNNVSSIDNWAYIVCGV